MRRLAVRAAASLRRRSLWSSLLELAGFGLITTAAYRYSVTLAFLVGGVLLVLVAYSIPPPRPPQ